MCHNDVTSHSVDLSPILLKILIRKGCRENRGSSFYNRKLVTNTTLNMLLISEICYSFLIVLLKATQQRVALERLRADQHQSLRLSQDGPRDQKKMHCTQKNTITNPSPIRQNDIIQYSYDVITLSYSNIYQINSIFTIK